MSLLDNLKEINFLSGRKKRFNGSVDSFGPKEFTGWFHDQLNDSEPVHVALRLDDEVLLSFTANQHRPDVAQAGFGNGASGFSRTLDVFDKLSSQEDLKRFTLELNKSLFPLTLFLEKKHWQPTEKESNENEETLEKIFFYPDYTANNPYQTALYSKFPDHCTVSSGSLVEAYRYLRQYPTHHVVFHLHWIKPILNGVTLDELKGNADSFLDLLDDFQNAGGRFIWTVHNKVSHDLHDANIFDFEVQFRAKLASRVDRLHLHSKTAIPILDEAYPIPENRVSIIPHGHYEGIYPNDISRAEARKKLDINSTALVFSFIGQIRPYKGIEELIVAFSSLNYEKRPVILLLAGKPVYPYKKGALEAMCSLIPNVIIHEHYIPDEELQVYMNASDFLVTPYRDILTSGSVLNALSFHLPVIAPEIGMIPEVISASNGVLYDAQDAQGLKGAMVKALSLDDQTLKSMSDKSKEVVKKFSWDMLSKTAYKSFFSRPKYKTRTIRTETGQIEYSIIENFNNQSSSDSVAVVVLNYENTDDTLRLVRSLRDSSWTHFDVLVVDNDSPNETMHSLARKFESETIIRCEKNIGYAGGNNVGALLAKDHGYDYIWIINPDTVVPIESMEQLVRKAKLHPEIDLHGTVLLRGDDSSRVLFAGGEVTVRNGLKVELLNAGINVVDLPKEAIETDYVSGASMFMKASLFTPERLIPEQYFLYYEETDWCYSMKKEGMNLCVHPDIHVFHHKNSEKDGLPTDYYLYYYVRSTLLFAKKHAPDQLDQTLEKLESTFIQPWLEKIEKRNKNFLPVAKALAETAVKDGMKNLSGPVSLTAIIENGISAISESSRGLGFLDRIDKGIVHGWAVDPLSPWIPAKVMILIDGIPAGEALANKFREDLKENAVQEGNAGFEFVIPSRFKTGSECVISLMFASTGTEFGNSKKTQLSPTSPDYKAFIEKPGAFQISGWAWDRNHPEKALEFEVLCEGQVIDTVRADQYRTDLQKAGMRDGYCGFTASLPTQHAAGGQKVFTLCMANGLEIARKTVSWDAKGRNVNLTKGGTDEYINWSFSNTQIPANSAGNTFSTATNILTSGTNALKTKYRDCDQPNLISVIMPAYNRADVIKDAIDSVCSQSYENWELIVVDDGSSDRLLRTLESSYGKLLEEKRLRYVRFEMNRGVSHARNIGLKQAKGEFIAYLDSDNVWDDGYLLTMTNELLNSQGFNCAYSGQKVLSYRSIDAEHLTDTIAIRGSAFNPALIENQNYIDLNIFFHHRSLFDNLGGFNPHMKRLVDWELILRYTFRNKPLFVPAILNTYSFGKVKNQITATEEFGSSHRVLKDSLARLLKSHKADHSKNTTKEKVDLLIVLDPEESPSSLSTLLALKSCAGLAHIIIVGDQATGHFKTASRIFEGLNQVSLLPINLEEVESYESAALPTGLNAVRNGAHLILIGENVMMNESIIRGFLSALTAYPNIGLAVSRRTVMSTQTKFHKFRKHAKSAGEYDLMAELIDENITSVHQRERMNLVEINRVPVFCNFFNAELMPMVKEACIDFSDRQLLIDQVVHAAYIAHGMKAVYLPDLRVYDRSYLG